jgi:hypothetical protein
MGIISFLIGMFQKKEQKKEENSLYTYESMTSQQVAEQPPLFEEIHSIWDYLSFRDNSQAYFISKIVGFEEWVGMDEILRRIEEIFQIKFKNERSLYPYIKTLVDVGLFEANSAGGKMKWRKKEVLIKITRKKKVEIESEIGAVKNTESVKK